MNTEFFVTQPGLTHSLINIKHQGEYTSLDAMNDNWVEIKLRQIMDNSTKAKRAVMAIMHSGITNHRQILKRFITCNWARLDHVDDIAADGTLHFEKTQCEQRFTCQHNGIICLNH